MKKSILKAIVLSLSLSSFLTLRAEPLEATITCFKTVLNALKQSECALDKSATMLTTWMHRDVSSVDIVIHLKKIIYEKDSATLVKLMNDEQWKDVIHVLLSAPKNDASAESTSKLLRKILKIEIDRGNKNLNFFMCNFTGRKKGGGPGADDVSIKCGLPTISREEIRIGLSECRQDAKSLYRDLFGTQGITKWDVMVGGQTANLVMTGYLLKECYRADQKMNALVDQVDRDLYFKKCQREVVNEALKARIAELQKILDHAHEHIQAVPAPENLASLDALLSQLGSSSPIKVKQAVVRIGNMGRAAGSAVPHLMEIIGTTYLSGTPDMELRLLTIYALGKVAPENDHQTIDALAEVENISPAGPMATAARIAIEKIEK